MCFVCRFYLFFPHFTLFFAAADADAKHLHLFRVHSEASSSQATAATVALVSAAQHQRCVCNVMLMLNQGICHTLIYMRYTFHHGVYGFFLFTLKFICWPGTFFSSLCFFAVLLSMIQCNIDNVNTMFIVARVRSFFSIYFYVWNLLPPCCLLIHFICTLSHFGSLSLGRSVDVTLIFPTLCIGST